MKKIILSAVFSGFITLFSFAQSDAGLPEVTAITHYKLSVGYNVTTILIFPSAIQQADRGERDLMTQKQTGIENVLKVKAARKGFQPTNLHIFTADGRVYAFDVTFTQYPNQTTYDLTRLKTNDSSSYDSKPKIDFFPTLLKYKQIANDFAKIKTMKPFLSSKTHRYKMELQLQTIYHVGDIIYFGCKILNKSSLPFTFDALRLYMRENVQVRRSSIQQRQIIPIYKDTVFYIPGKSDMQFIMAFHQFTIPDHRQLVLEIIERDGGRDLTLKITNQQLLKAREL